MSIKLLLVESVTAGAFDRPLAPGLLAEAEAMLAAMVAEVVLRPAAAMPALTVRVLRRWDLPLPSMWRDHAVSRVGSAAPLTCIAVPAEGWGAAWRGALLWADAVWLVAPETGGELETLARQVETAGARLLGASAAAIAVTASKSATYLALQGRVRQPWTVLPGRDDGAALAADSACCTAPAWLLKPDAWLIKPDDGVDAAGIRRLPASVRGGTASSPVPAPVPPAGHIVQAFVDGEPLSLCLLSDGQRVRVLSVNRQRIEWDAAGCAHYRGGVTNALADRARFAALAQTVQDALPGLWGCWGIDCVLADEGDPVLIEVNPRLTTAFAHLRAATGFDLLGALLGLIGGASLPQAAAGHPVVFAVTATGPVAA